MNSFAFKASYFYKNFHSSGCLRAF